MNISVDSNSRVPIYEQIINKIEELVILGILAPGEQIPSIRDLAISLGVNPNTIKKAYDILNDKHIIRSDSTKGTFINDDIDALREKKIKLMIEEINEIISALEELGIKKEDILKKIKETWK